MIPIFIDKILYMVTSHSLRTWAQQIWYDILPKGKQWFGSSPGSDNQMGLGFLTRVPTLYLLRMFSVYSARKHCCFYFKCLCVVCSPCVCVLIVWGGECKLPWKQIFRAQQHSFSLMLLNRQHVHILVTQQVRASLKISSFFFQAHNAALLTKCSLSFLKPQDCWLPWF